MVFVAFVVFVVEFFVVTVEVVLVVLVFVVRGLPAAEARQPEAGQVESGGRPADPAEPAAERAELLLLQVNGRLPRLAYRGEHQVRDGRGGLRRVRGIDHAGVDRDVEQLAHAADHGPDRTATRRPG